MSLLTKESVFRTALTPTRSRAVAQSAPFSRSTGRGGNSAHPLRKRLWQGGLAVALLLSILLTVEAIARNGSGSHHLSLGEDFLPVYSAGKLIAQGHSSQLYVMDAMAEIERKTVADADLDPLPLYGTFLNPPFFAAAYVPFAALPYRSALAVWLGINLLLAGGSIVLLCRMLPSGATWREWGLVPLLFVLPLPFWEAMYHQQNTFVSLFLLCWFVTLWRKESGAATVAAGLIAGLLFFKPQLAVAVAAVLALTRGWRALVGISISGATLLALTRIFMPGCLSAFLRTLPPVIDWMRNHRPYNWGRQVTPQSFWRLILQGGGIGPTETAPKIIALVMVAAIALGLLWATVIYLRSSRESVRLDRLIAATIISMPMLMPYYMDYDLMLLAIPAVLLAAEGMQRSGEIGEGEAPGEPKFSQRPRLGGSLALPRIGKSAGLVESWSDRLLYLAWAALFLEMFVNPGLARRTGLNLAVPLIAAITILSIWRSLRNPRHRSNSFPSPLSGLEENFSAGPEFSHASLER